MSELSPTKYVSELVPGRETSLLLRLSTPEPQINYSGSQKVQAQNSFDNQRHAQFFFPTLEKHQGRFYHQKVEFFSFDR